MTGTALPWRSVWITGASSGIGRELALQLARRGASVAVSARDGEKLGALAEAHPGISAFPLDVSDAEATRAAARQITRSIGPIDLALLNAGVWKPMGASDFDAGFVNRATQINLGGVVNGLDAVLPDMLARKQGHIAITASVAGYRGLPRSAAYAPSKAALISLAEGLRTELSRKGIAITVINPGFVDTPMTAVNDFPMPFLMPVGDAAQRILTGLMRRKFEIAFPWQLAGVLKLARVMPYPVYFWLERNVLAPPRRK